MMHATKSLCVSLLLSAAYSTNVLAQENPANADGSTLVAIINFSTGLLFLGFLVGGVALYFMPTILAFRRKHANRYVIFLINLVFGITIFGWVGSLIWAVNAVHKSESGYRGGESGLNVFGNDPQPVSVALVRNPGKPDDVTDKLRRLKILHGEGALTDEEYRRARGPLIDRLTS